MSTADAADDLRHTMELDAGWTSFGGIQGGLVLGAAVDAARAVTGRHPRSAHALMMRAVQPGELTLDSEVLRTGRGTSAVSVHGSTRNGLALVAGVLLSTEPVDGPPDGQGAGPGDLATPSDLFAAAPDDVEEDRMPRQFVPFAQHLEYRPVGATYPMAGGSEAVLACWVRVRPDEAPALSRSTVTAVLLDALPPSAMATRTTPVYAATADLSVHLTGPGLAAGEWGRLVQRAHWTDEHTSVDDAVLRDEAGRLVAVSRQTRRMIPAPS